MKDITVEESISKNARKIREKTIYCDECNCRFVVDVFNEDSVSVCPSDCHNYVYVPSEPGNVEQSTDKNELVRKANS